MSTPSANRLESRLGGITLEGRPHQLSAWAVVGLRIVMGLVLLTAGYGKLTGGFSAEGYLANVTPASPASGIYAAMASDPALLAAVDVIVPTTQVLMGLALVAGAAVRLAAFGATLQMTLFYLGSWPIAEEGLLGAVNNQFVYAAVFLALGAFAAGRILGVDRHVESLGIVRRYPALGYLLG